MHKRVAFFFQLVFLFAVAYAQVYYYRCDENFSVIELIPDSSAYQHQFYMKKIIIGNGEEQYFYKNQILQKKVLIKNEAEKTTEETWEGDQLIEAKTYNKSILVYEKYFSKNLGEYEILNYIYKDNLLVRIDIQRESGGSYSIDYIFDAAKKVRAISINKKIINLASFSKSRILTTWNQGEFIVEYYNDSMLLQKRETYTSSGQMTSRTTMTYDNENLVSSILSNMVQGTSTSRIYADGLLREEREENIKTRTVLLIKQYHYNESRLCVKFIQIEGANTKVIEYSYDDEAKKNQEKIFSNGKLIQITSWTSESDYIVEYYETEGIILKVFFTNGKKTKEEAWQDNVLLFEKQYQ